MKCCQCAQLKSHTELEKMKLFHLLLDCKRKKNALASVKEIFISSYTLKTSDLSLPIESVVYST